MIANIDAVRLCHEVIEIDAADLYADRSVSLYFAFGTLNLNVNPDVRRLVPVNHLHLAVRPIVPPISALTNEIVTL